MRLTAVLIFSATNEGGNIELYGITNAATRNVAHGSCGCDSFVVAARRYTGLQVWRPGKVKLCERQRLNRHAACGNGDSVAMQRFGNTDDFLGLCYRRFRGKIDGKHRTYAIISAARPAAVENP